MSEFVTKYTARLPKSLRRRKEKTFQDRCRVRMYSTTSGYFRDTQSLISSSSDSFDDKSDLDLLNFDSHSDELNCLNRFGFSRSLHGDKFGNSTGFLSENIKKALNLSDQRSQERLSSATLRKMKIRRELDIGYSDEYDEEAEERRRMQDEKVFRKVFDEEEIGRFNELSEQKR